MNELPDPASSSHLLQWGGGIVATIAAVAITVQKVLRSWAADKVERITDEARADVIGGLVSEIRRMREQNDELAKELNSVQLAMAKMAGENYRLQIEVKNLQDKITMMIRINAEGLK